MTWIQAMGRPSSCVVQYTVMAFYIPQDFEKLASEMFKVIGSLLNDESDISYVEVNPC